MSDKPKSLCLNCGKELICNIPFTEGEHYGMKSEPHGCPEEFDHYQVDSFKISSEEFDTLLQHAKDQEGAVQ